MKLTVVFSFMFSAYDTKAVVFNQKPDVAQKFTVKRMFSLFDKFIMWHRNQLLASRGGDRHLRRRSTIKGEKEHRSQVGTKPMNRVSMAGEGTPIVIYCIRIAKTLIMGKSMKPSTRARITLRSFS